MVDCEDSNAEEFVVEPLAIDVSLLDWLGRVS
jgi:hypothetical protein